MEDKNNGTPVLSSTAEIAVKGLQQRIKETAVAQAVTAFLRVLMSGLEVKGMVDSCHSYGDSLIIKLHSSMIGTIATRSRVPAEWLVLPTLEIAIEESSTTGGTKLRLNGLEVTPIEGAVDAWKVIHSRFEAEGAKTLEDRREVAWNWWDTGGGRETFEGTKFWRTVESLAGLGFGGMTVPRDAKATLLLGCTLSTRQKVTTFHFRCDDSLGERKITVVGTLKPVPATFGPASPDYSYNEQIRDAIGRELWAETSSSKSKRLIAEKFATSALNYGALFCARDGEPGASSESLQKLFTVARNHGGATNLDFLKGRASSWQYNDETYQMTGGDGRVVWRPYDGDILLDNVTSLGQITGGWTCALDGVEICLSSTPLDSGDFSEQAEKEQCWYKTPYKVFLKCFHWKGRKVRNGGNHRVRRSREN